MRFFWRRAKTEPVRSAPVRDPRVERHVRQLREEGFAHIEEGVPRALAAEILASTKAFLARNAEIFDRHRDQDGHYPRIVNMHALHQPLLQLFTASPVALGVQDAFFGARSSIYTSLYYERGSAQPIHRDTPVFSTRPEYRYLGIWVALEEANDDNGCLEIIRKGHLIPEFDREAIALEHFSRLEDVPPIFDPLWSDYQRRVVSACTERGLQVERLHAKPGDVIIWHPQLPHGGSAIGDITRTRHSLVMHVVPEGTPVYHQDVFFNPKKKMSETASWGYRERDGRKHVAHTQIDIGHREQRPNRDFRP